VSTQDPSPKKQKVVAVYGGAAIPVDHPDYKDAFEVGRLLAQNGLALLTGGYAGIMGAASEGAHAAGGRVIGVTVGLFRERGLVPNPYLHEEVHLPSLSERTMYLITEPDAYIVMRGGIGTLAELGMAWSLMQVHDIPPRPLILVGGMWRETMATFARVSTIGENEHTYITLVDTVAEVIPMLQQWWTAPPALKPRLGDVAPNKANLKG